MSPNLSYLFQIFAVRRIGISVPKKFPSMAACLALKQTLRHFADLKPNTTFILFTVMQAFVKKYPITILLHGNQRFVIRLV